MRIHKHGGICHQIPNREDVYKRQVRYNALKKKVADSTLGTPSVMLNVPYGDSWFMPSTQSYEMCIRDSVETMPYVVKFPTPSYLQTSTDRYTFADRPVFLRPLLE